MKRRKGNAAILILATVIVAFVTFAWMTVSPMFMDNWGNVNDQLSGDEDAQDTLSLIKWNWLLWPVLIIASMIAWVISGSQRKEATFTGFMMPIQGV